MRARSVIRWSFGILAAGVVAAPSLTLDAQQSSRNADAATITNASVRLTVASGAKDFSLAVPGSSADVLRALCSIEIEGAHIACADYPNATTAQSPFTDDLGAGDQLITTFSGLAGKPDLERVLRVYKNSPFGSITLRVVNHTSAAVTVHSFRPITVSVTENAATKSRTKAKANATKPIDLGGPDARDRVLADSFSEDRPTERIYDLGKAPDYRSFDDLSEKSSGLHVGVGSQLIFNRDSGRDLFMGALTSRKFLTIFHLATTSTANGPAIQSLTVDSTGTKEPQTHEALSKATPENLFDASVAVPPGESLESEPILFATSGGKEPGTGNDYHAHLEAYGAAVAKVNHPRLVGRAPAGWWSWTSYYAGVTDGLVRTNARWMSQNLKSLGFDHVLIDEGYQYARGEFTTTDAMHFPDGMIGVGHAVCEDGLTFGVWTAPFEVSKRAWVYEHHKDWLVHNAAGEPIPILQPEIEQLFALDTTNPGAQAYLTQTYRTLTHDWGVRYIKLDFMDDAAIEGVHYAPNTTAIEAQRIGLKIIRDAVGEDVQLDKDGSAMLAPIGLVDEGRVSTDTGHSWEPSKTAASGIAERYYMNRNFYVTDPDAFTLTDSKGEGGSPGTTMDEAQVSIVLAAVAGGMYEIGDDLPLLGTEPQRLKLVRNRDLLAMYKYGHAAVPLDLMSYEDADEQPSIFVLHEGASQTMLAIFNWTDKPRSHTFSAADLGLPADHKFFAVDALDDKPAAVASAAPFSFTPPVTKAELRDQPPHSVRLIKIVDQTVTVPPLDFRINVPASTEAGKPATLTLTAPDPSNPAIDYLWAFGDGTSDTGDAFRHTYTRAGDYEITVTATNIQNASTSRTATIHIVGEVSPDFHFDQNKRQQQP